MNPSTHFGKYHLLDKIGSGGMAELFLARQTGLSGFEKVVAIKRILPHLIQSSEFVTMFVNEAKLAALLSHQNIVQIYDLGNIDSAYFIAMEYVMGKDLRTLLSYARSKNLLPSIGDILIITSKICSALDYAHRKKDLNGTDLHLVHRDISPQNILVSYEGEVKLVDFGIAKAATGVQETKTGVLKGKLAYMSPEQAWGKPIDHRTDIFALGIVLYEALTGHRLFTGNNEISILEKVRQADVPAPTRLNPGIPSELEGILLRALAKEPENRYQTASEMQMALESLITQKGYAFSSLSLSNYMKILYEEEMIKDTKRVRSVAGGDPPPPIEDRSTVVRPSKPSHHSSPQISKSRNATAPPLPVSGGGRRMPWLVSSLSVLTLLFFLLLLSDFPPLKKARGRFPILETTRNNVQSSLERIGLPSKTERLEEGVGKGERLPAGIAPEEASRERPSDEGALQDQNVTGRTPQNGASSDPAPAPVIAPPGPSSSGGLPPAPISAPKSEPSPAAKADLQTLYREAKENYNAGHFDEVEKNLRRIIEIDPGAVTAYHLLGTVYQEKKDFDTALRIFSDASALFPNNATLHYDLGFLYFEKGIDSLARQELTEALALAPDAPPHSKARDILRKVTPRRNPGNPTRFRPKTEPGEESPAAPVPPSRPVPLPPSGSTGAESGTDETPPSSLSPAARSPSEEQEQIRQLILKQKRALQAKDVEDFFRDHLNPASHIQQKVKNWIPRFDALSVNYEIYKIKVEGTEASASILETIVLQSRQIPRQVEKALVYWKFSKVDGAWKITQMNVVEQYSPSP